MRTASNAAGGIRPEHPSFITFSTVEKRKRRTLPPEKSSSCRAAASITALIDMSLVSGRSGRINDNCCPNSARKRGKERGGGGGSPRRYLWTVIPHGEAVGEI